MSYKPTLIFLPLLLVVGVVSSASLNDEDGDILRPFVSNSQKRRICVELCLSGLGGSPCGEECADITPMNMPIQSRRQHNATRHTVKVENVTRDDSCNVLCINSLGRPLCACDEVNAVEVKRTGSDPDFLQICGYFCISYNYRLNGCQKCFVYKSSWANELLSQSPNPHSNPYSSYSTAVDWPTWCSNQCSQGNGGAACNCDRLPLY